MSIEDTTASPKPAPRRVSMSDSIETWPSEELVEAAARAAYEARDEWLWERASEFEADLYRLRARAALAVCAEERDAYVKRAEETFAELRASLLTMREGRDQLRAEVSRLTSSLDSLAQDHARVLQERDRYKRNYDIAVDHDISVADVERSKRDEAARANEVLNQALIDVRAELEAARADIKRLQKTIVHKDAGLEYERNRVESLTVSLNVEKVHHETAMETMRAYQRQLRELPNVAELQAERDAAIARAEEAEWKVDQYLAELNFASSHGWRLVVPDDAEEQLRREFNRIGRSAEDIDLAERTIDLVRSWLAPRPEQSAAERCEKWCHEGCTGDSCGWPVCHEPAPAASPEPPAGVSINAILADPYERQRLREDIVTEVVVLGPDDDVDQTADRVLRVLDAWAAGVGS